MRGLPFQDDAQAFGLPGARAGARERAAARPALARAAALLAHGPGADLPGGLRLPLPGLHPPAQGTHHPRVVSATRVTAEEKFVARPALWGGMLARQFSHSLTSQMAVGKPLKTPGCLGVDKIMRGTYLRVLYAIGGTLVSAWSIVTHECVALIR